MEKTFAIQTQVTHNQTVRNVYIMCNNISERTISTFPTVDVCRSLWAGSSKDLVEMVLRKGGWVIFQKRPKETENRTGPHSEKGPGPGLLYPSFPI